jgi:sugar lactone lactonase YvrE
VCDDPPPGVICTVAGTGQAGSNGDDGPALDQWLFAPRFGAVDPEGRFAFADYNNERIRRIEDDQLVTIAGNGGHAYATDGVPALATPLENPASVAFAPDGTFWVYEQHGARVLRVDGDDVLTVFAGSVDAPGYSLYFGDGGPARGGGLSQGNDLAVGPDGTLYVADTCNNAVRSVTPDGILHTVIAAGPPVTATTYAYCTPADGEISWPWGLAVDGDALYVSELGSNAITRVDLTTGEPATVVPPGPGGSPDGLYGPAGMSVGPDGALYVADSANHAIRRVEADGSLTTVVGEAGVDGFEDGVAPEDTHLWSPTDVEVTADGDLYVVDTLNQRIRRVLGFAAP